MTIVEGNDRSIVIDTLTTPGAAREALKPLLRRTAAKPDAALI